MSGLNNFSLTLSHVKANAQRTRLHRLLSMESNTLIRDSLNIFADFGLKYTPKLCKCKKLTIIEELLYQIELPNTISSIRCNKCNSRAAVIYYIRTRGHRELKCIRWGAAKLNNIPNLCDYRKLLESILPDFCFSCNYGYCDSDSGLMFKYDMNAQKILGTRKCNNRRVKDLIKEIDDSTR